MYVKLTQLNGKPIWFNQDYVVTVEPSKKGGALVVPLGDGLDYEVLESPAAIVESLGGSLVPSPPAVLQKAPPKQAEPAAAEEPSLPDFRIDGGLIVPVASPSQPAAVPEKKKEEALPRKTRKHTTTKRGAKSTAAENPAEAAAEKKTRKTAKKGTSAKSKTVRKESLPALPLTDEQLVRLQKMSPGSMRKLVNTLMSQFAIAETTPVVDALMAREIISVTDQGHVNWKWRQVMPSGEE